jgi:RNA polymerase sigma-70 factor (ECF subfamily)
MTPSGGQGQGGPARLIYLSSGDLQQADDATLATALIAADLRAPRVTWARFAPMVHRMLKRAFGPGQDIDDMAQDVFLCLFRKLPGLREPKALKSFVVAITVKTIQYEIRRRRIRSRLGLTPARDPESGMDDRSIEQPDPAARQALRRFYAILDMLSAKDRTAFVLRFFEGMELTEVADALAISLSTTKRLLDKVWKRVSLLVERSPGLAAYLSFTGDGAQPDGSLTKVQR